MNIIVPNVGDRVCVSTLADPPVLLRIGRVDGYATDHNAFSVQLRAFIMMDETSPQSPMSCWIKRARVDVKSSYSWEIYDINTPLAASEER